MTKCISGGHRNYITGVTYTTANAALAVTKSRGARRDISNSIYSSVVAGHTTTTTTCVLSYCFTYLTGNTGAWRSSGVRHATGGRRGPSGCLLR